MATKDKQDRQYLPENYIDSIDILFRVKKTQINMMNRREYKPLTPEDHILNMNLVEFKNFYDKKIVQNKTEGVKNASFVSVLDMEYQKEVPSGHLNADGKFDMRVDKIYVMFVEFIPGKSIKDTHKWNVGFLSNIPIHNAIMITEKKLDATSISLLKSFKNLNISLFNYAQLIYDITESPFTSKYRVLGPEDKKLFINEETGLPYLAKNELPKARFADPAVKFYGAVPGNILHESVIYPEIPIMVPETIIFSTVTGQPLDDKKSGNELAPEIVN